MSKIHLSKSPFSTRILIAVLLFVGLGSLVVAGFIIAQEEYAIYDGSGSEAPIMVAGNFQTIGDVLDAADVTVRPEDIVQPALSAPAAPSTAIQIQRAQAVTVRTETDGTRTLFTHQPTIGAFLAEAGISVQRTTQIYADETVVPFTALDQTPLPSVLEIGRFLTVTIQEGGQQQVVRTAAQTVGGVLEENNIEIFAADGVEPPLGSWLEPEMVIQVQRSFPLSIQVDGRLMQVRSHHTNALDVLAEVGIGLVGYDYTRPGPEVPLQPNSTIEVIRVTEDFRFVDEPIPYQTLWQASDELDIDTRAVISYGAPGIKRQRIRVRYENGVEASQTVDSEWVAREPVNEVMGYGTRINIGTVNTPEGPREYWRVVRMRVTAYTAASSGKSPGDPGYGITASGRPAGTGIVAIDRSVVPFGSEVYVPGYGVGYAGDTGGGVRGRWIDLGYDEDEYRSWSGYVDVYYLTPIPAPEDINYLLPTTLP